MKYFRKTYSSISEQNLDLNLKALSNGTAIDFAGNSMDRHIARAYLFLVVQLITQKGYYQ